MSVPPACAGKVGRFRRWHNGRRAERAWPFCVGACVCGPLSARVRSFTQPPNPPIKRDRLRRGNQGDFSGFGGRVGSLWATRWAAIPTPIFRTERLLANVGGDCVAGVSCHQRRLIVPRRYRRAASFGSTRAAQLVRVSVAGTWPAFHGGWPVRRGVVAVGSGRCRPRGVGTVGEVLSVDYWSAGEAGVAITWYVVRSRPAIRLRAFIHSAAQPAHQA
jgi:hypothetical protein